MMMINVDVKKLAARLTVLSIILLAGCDNRPIEFHEGLAAVEKDGKWGYIDTLENVVIPHLYDSVGHFAGGVAVVGLNKKIGTIDKGGMVIIAVKYDSIGRFTDNVAIVGDSGKYGFVDISGKEVIALLYESVEPFVDGWATVVQNGDTFRIHFKYDALDNFSEGLAPVKFNEKYGYVDKTGEILPPEMFIEFVYKRTGQSVGGIPVAKLDNNNFIFKDACSGKQLSYKKLIIGGKVVVRMRVVADWSAAQGATVEFLFNSGGYMQISPKNLQYKLENGILTVDNI